MCIRDRNPREQTPNKRRTASASANHTNPQSAISSSLLQFPPDTLIKGSWAGNEKGGKGAGAVGTQAQTTVGSCTVRN
eukprot:220225-Alexandrium_andersonii.AAC.1